MSGSFSNNLSVITTTMRHFAEPPTNKVVCSKSIYHFRHSRLKNDILFSFHSPINREFYLAKGTEKFILGRYLLSVCDLGGLPLAPPYWRIVVQNHIFAIISLSVRDTSIKVIIENAEHAILYIFSSLCFFVRSIVS
jgi:hypothetical protein